MKIKFAELEHIMHPDLKEQMKKNKIKLETKHFKIIGKATDKVPIKIDFLYCKTTFGQFMFVDENMVSPKPPSFQFPQSNPCAKV